ncbi:hypothetical protein GINT2_000041 [Glugoides intestinalis]
MSGGSFIQVKDGVYTHNEYENIPGPLDKTISTLLEMFIAKKNLWGSDPLLSKIKGETIEKISYDTLDLNSRKLAEYLQDVNKEKELVAIISINRPEWLVAEYATYYANCTNVPLHLNYDPNVILDILSKMGIKTVVSSKEAAEILFRDVFSQENENLKLKTITLILLDDIDENDKEFRTYVSKYSESKKCNVKYLSEILKEKTGLELRRQRPKGEDLASICFTSGTSGTPKGVRLTHANFIAQIKAFKIASESYGIFKVNRDDVYLSYLPLAHVLERMCVSISIYSGAEVAFYSGVFKNLSNDMKKHRPTFISCVPKVIVQFHKTIEEAVQTKPFYQRILFKIGMKYKLFMQRFGVYNSWIWDPFIFKKISQAFGGKIRACLCGGASIDPEIIRYMQAIWSAKIFQGYGQTEGIGANLLDTIDSRDVSSVGFPFPSTQIKLVSPDPEAGYPKEYKVLYLRGPAISIGYVGESSLSTDQNSDDSWLNTKDLAVVDKNNRFYIVGRLSDIIKLSNGEFINLESLEKAVYSVTSKYASDVYILQDNDKESIVALVCPTEAFKNTCHTIIEQNIRDAIKDASKNPKNDVPSRFNIHAFVFIDSSLRDDIKYITPSLKLKRKAINDNFKDKICRALAQAKLSAASSANKDRLSDPLTESKKQFKDLFSLKKTSYSDETKKRQ